MANPWENIEQEQAVNPWEMVEADTGAPAQAAPQAPQETMPEYLMGAAETGAKFAGEGAKFIGDVGRNFIAGAAQVPTEMAAYALETGENLGAVGQNLYRRATDQPPVQPDYTASQFVREKGQQAAQIIRPEDQGMGGRVVEEVGKYALPSGLITKSMINSGTLLKNSGQTLNAFENMMVDVAKDPAKALKLDQAVNAVMATVGQLSTESGATPAQRALLEIGSGITAGMSISQIAKWGGKGVDIILDTISTLRGIEPTRKASITKGITDTAVGEYLNDVTAAQPDFWGNVAENTALSQKRNVKMDLPELAVSPELKAAKQMLISEKQGGATTKLTSVSEGEKQVREAFGFDPKQIEIAEKSITREITDSVKAVELKLEKSLVAANKQAKPLRESSITESGKAATVRIDEAEDLVNSRIGKAYAKVGFDESFNTDIIRKGIKEGRKTDLPLNEWRGELSPHLKKIMDNLIGVKQAPKGKAADAKFKRLEDYATAPGKKKKEVETLTLKGIQELQTELKTAIREARYAGKDQLTKSLGGVLDSTYKQLDNATGLAGDNARLLKAANQLSRKAHLRFDDARVSILNKVDIQGTVKTAPEDVIKNIIKTDGQTNSKQAVTSYQNAVGDPTKAKDVLRQGFIAKLAVNALNKPVVGSGEFILNPKATQNFLNKHKNFLEASGLKSEFKDAAAASKTVGVQEEKLAETISNLAKSELAKWVRSDDTVGYIANAIKSGKIKTLLKEAKNKPLVKLGINEAAWEGVLKQTNTVRGVDGFQNNLTVDGLQTALQQNGKNLKLALGEKHYKNTVELAKIIRSIKTKGSNTAGFVTQKEVDEMMAKLLRGLRAASHGFVKPELIVAEMGRNMYANRILAESKKTLAIALTDPLFAQELINVYRKGAVGEKVVNTLFMPFVTFAARGDWNDAKKEKPKKIQ